MSLYVYARNEFVIDVGLIVILFDLDNAQLRHRLASLPACHYGKLDRGRTIGIREKETEPRRVIERASKNTSDREFLRTHA